MAANDKAVDALRDLASQGKHLDRETGRTGRWDEANNRIHPNPTIGLPANRIWVRLDATLDNPRGRAEIVAWNFQKVTTRRADRAVELELNASGKYRVSGADEEAATVQNGVLATYDFRGDAPPPELNDANNRTENLFELKPYSPAGLLVGVKPGWVGRHYWWDSATLALTPTATASSMAWVALYVDTSGASLALGQALGADKSLAYTKNIADVETLLATLPDTAVPICAVLLANGATTINLNDASVFDDVRALVNTGEGGGGGHEILVDDVPQVQRAGLNLQSGPGILITPTDDALDDETEVDVELDIDALPEDTTPDSATSYVPVSTTGGLAKTSISDLLVTGGFAAPLIQQFAYNTTSPMLIGQVKAGQLVPVVHLIIITPFDGTVSLTVGDSGDNDRLMLATENSPLAVGTYLAYSGYKYGSDTDVNLYLSAVGSTQGAGIVYVDVPGNVGISNVGGSAIIGRGTYASLPASGTNVGDTYFCTDAPYTFYWDGSAWKARFRDLEVVVPPSSGWSWVNQGAATIDFSRGFGFLHAPPVLAANYRIQARTAPATPYTIDAVIVASLWSVTNASVAVGFRQSSDGKLHMLGIFEATRRLSSTKFTNPTTYAGSGYAEVNRTDIPLIFRIQDNGTNRITSISDDGVNYQVFTTVGRTDYLTADQVWFGANSVSASWDAGLSLISWKVS